MKAKPSTAIVKYLGSGAYVTARLDGVLYVSELDTPASSLVAPVAKLLKDFGNKRVSIVIASEEPPVESFSVLLRTNQQRANHVVRGVGQYATNPKLTPQAVRRAQIMRSSGKSLRETAEALGVPMSTLGARLARENH